MKNIFKILMVLFLPLLLINSCRDEADKNWTSPEATINLYNTTLGSNTLYPSMAGNTFRLTWDALAGAGTYTVQFSTTADFAKPIVLGTSTTNIYTTTIGALNTALLQAGYSPYSQTMMFIRVISGTNVSNVISLGVTPYPTAKPVITSPTVGQAIVLNSATPSANALTVTWTDYATYGVPVNYLVELAKKGTTNFKTVGTVTDVKSLALTHVQLDQVAFAAGGVANVQGDFDIRVTAKTTSTGGSIVAVSDVVSFKITPYELISYLYAPGNYQGWNPTTANTLVSTTSNGIYIGYINFEAAGSEFKITQNRNWDVNWGSTNGTDLVSNGDNIKSPNAGYYKITVDMNTMKITMTPYSMGLVGDATPNGWNGPDLKMNWDDANLAWTVTNALTAGDIKFRVNNDWAENYGGTNGQASAGGNNITVTAGTHTVTFKPFSMTYTVQ